MSQRGLFLSYLTWSATTSLIASVLLAVTSTTLLNLGVPDVRLGREDATLGMVTGLFFAGVLGALCAGPVAAATAILRRLVCGAGGSPELTPKRARLCMAVGVGYTAFIGLFFLST